MKIFFVLRHTGYLRNYTDVIYKLAQNGHKIHIGVPRAVHLFDEQQLKEFVGDSTNITYAFYNVKKRMWDVFATRIRLVHDYLRYLNPAYRSATGLTKRMTRKLNSPMLEFLFSRILVRNSYRRVWFWSKVLRCIECAIPENQAIRNILRSCKPDVFLITPLVEIGANQLDWIKSARSLQILSGLCVASWDNLTNKGIIQIAPDFVIVWNEIQKKEATEMHRISESSIAVTGAQCYDHWFARKPATTATEFCQKIGIDSRSPYVLYVCSSSFIAPQEATFVKSWLQSIRNDGDPLLKKLGVLVRPHPQNFEQWRKCNLDKYQNVAIYPRLGCNPVGENAKAEFYDSMYHSIAVIGINTSAMIESGILGKPVLTILSSEFKDTQQGTLHFHYLAEGGLLSVGENFQQHLLQLKAVLKEEESAKESRRNFIGNFVRPAGLEQEASSLFVSAVEKFHADFTPEPLPLSLLHFVLTIFLLPIALLLTYAKKMRKLLRRFFKLL